MENHKVLTMGTLPWNLQTAGIDSLRRMQATLVLPIQAAQLPDVHADRTLGLNRFSLEFCPPHEVVNECFAKPFILVAEGFDKSPPVWVPHRRREGNPSALKVDEAGLVVVQEFRWHLAALVAMLPDIVKVLGL